MESKGGFSGRLGFVMAAAGSAVGVGNIWRFPYLAARDGGGLFIIVYLILVLTFGFTLLTTDIAIGRKTQQSSIRAYQTVKKGWGFLGFFTFLVPVFIMTYYGVIGGWISKYIVTYVVSSGEQAAGDTFFTDFITAQYAPIIFALIFVFFTALIVYRGVEKGIEKVSKFIMPILLIMIVFISIFSLTLHHEDASGTIRTGLQGLAVYLIPNVQGLTGQGFMQVLLDAMGQLFFSLSVSMGIMITYGSYVKKDVNLGRSVGMIEVFDTVVALLAGLMIIPAVYVFSGLEGMAGGPGLIFISLPKVFVSMGAAGRWFGLIFFIMVAFAALTSCVSVLETIVANCMEIFKSSRAKTTIILTVIYAAASLLICLGYNKLYFELTLPNGATAQLLDVMDYISNNVMMPAIAFFSCILIGWIVTPKWVIDEMELTGDVFRRKKLYYIMVKFVMPVMMAALFLQSTGILGRIFG